MLALCTTINPPGPPGPQVVVEVDGAVMLLKEHQKAELLRWSRGNWDKVAALQPRLLCLDSCAEPEMVAGVVTPHVQGEWKCSQVYSRILHCPGRH